MDNNFPVQRSGKWIFHLQQANTLQFHIISEQETNSQFSIEGHEINALLDYLYDHREQIYEATHDQDLRHLEALEIQNVSSAAMAQERHFETILYFDDGVQRVRADIDG